MSRFYVGQRVKKVRSEATPARRLGEEAVVSSVGRFKPGDILWDGTTCMVECDCTVTFVCDGIDYTSRLNLWEPIVPPGMESITETLALWLPEGQNA